MATTGAARVPLNQWLRDGASIDGNSNPVAVGATGCRAGDPRHPLVANAIIDIAGAIDTVQDSKIVKNVAADRHNPWTRDGIQTKAIGHVAMAALVTTSGFA